MGPRAFPHLLAPGRIGTLELRNRILMAPLGDHLCHPDGTVSPNQAAYFEARARGGAALLIVGSVSVAYPRASFDARQVAISDDCYVPGLRDLTERVHRHGARVAAQLVHNGQLSLLDVANGLPVLVPSEPKPSNPDRIFGMVTPEEIAAMMSPYAQPTSRLEYREATEADIAEVIELFATAAERCVAAGFDAIELHAGHGYLLDGFLSPSSNRRTDGWGGPVPNRARLLCDVLHAIRARLGPEYPVWIRINAVEHHKPDGETFDDQLQVIDLAIEAGIDAVHLTAYANADVATGPTDSYVPHTVGSLADDAAVLRRRVHVPVITFGRFEPDEAEQVLAGGKADFVAMGRKLLADPDLPNKLAAGRSDDIRPCIYQYRCIGNIFVKEPLHCVARAATGREGDHDVAVTAARAPRQVLVAGGGPAGLEAARLLADRGHRVTLWEASERLGGMLGLAAPADPLLDRYLGWLIRQVEQADVAIELGSHVTVEAAQALAPDAVIVATGARWDRPTISGIDQAHVHMVPELRPWLEGNGNAQIGERVIVLGGGEVGLSLADRCLREGRTVTIVEPSGVFGAELGLPGRFRRVADLETAGAVLVANAMVDAVEDDGVRVLVGDTVDRFGADSVLVASTPIPDGALAASLRDVGLDVHEVGDCHAVAMLEGANLDAVRVAAALS
jgi:2,4-dienoyl-CoA reductase (NADPH2)